MTDDEKTRLWWVLALAVVGGGGSSTLLQMMSSEARHDPYTGKEGRRLEREVSELWGVVRNLPPDDWELRIEKMEEFQVRLWERQAEHSANDGTWYYRLETLEETVERLNAR